MLKNPLLFPLPALCLLVAGACTVAPAALAQSTASAPSLSALATPSAAGRYYGVLPCANCSGIAHLLRLQDDGSYRLRRIYLDNGNALLSESGRWSWNADHTQLLLEGGAEPLRFAWQNDSALALLDRAGQTILSSHGNYQLLRTTTAP
ncbi:MAG: copper resistance protein NlpE N-terminal domain-containing protein [Rhodoferax sp.]|nr:copper resistance protein NlpE N-terminal domain-containing protein [Rhodoferax sp.]